MAAIAFKFSDGEWRAISRIAILALALMTTYPLLTSNWLGMHDIQFHAARISSIAQGIKSAVIPVRLYETQAYGFGYPCGICYPDAFLYIPAILNCLGMGLRASYVLFIFVINLATAVIANVSFRKIGGSRFAGLVGCVLWTLAPYRFVNVLLRAAVGESLALMFGPLLLLGLWKAFLDDASSSGAGWLELGFAIAGIIYSHVLSIVLYLIWGIPLLIALVICRKKKGVLKALCKGVLFAILLSAAFLVPFIDYYSSHDLLVKTITPRAYKHTVELAQLFATFLNNSGRSLPLGESLMEEMPLNVGWSLLCMGLTGVLVMMAPTFMTSTDYRNQTRGWLIALCILASMMMLLTTHLFPWRYDELPAILDGVIRRMGVIQYPWRFLGLASLTLSLIGVIVAANSDVRIRTVLLFCLLLAVVECGYATGTFTREANRKEGGLSSTESAQIGNGEYLPASLDLQYTEDWSENGFEPMVDSNQVTIKDFKRITPQRLRFSIENNSKSIQHVRLPYFWHQQLVLSEEHGGDLAGLSLENDNGYASISIEPAIRGSYVLEFIEPLHWRIAEAISLLSLLSVVGAGIFLWRRRKGGGKISMSTPSFKSV